MRTLYTIPASELRPGDTILTAVGRLRRIIAGPDLWDGWVWVGLSAAPTEEGPGPVEVFGTTQSVEVVR